MPSELRSTRTYFQDSALNVGGKWYSIESILTTAETGKQGIKRVCLKGFIYTLP